MNQTVFLAKYFVFCFELWSFAGNAQCKQAPQNLFSVGR